MPVPIGRVPDNSKEAKNTGDYSFLFNQPLEKKTTTASNKDASMLLEIWSKGERVGSSDGIKINSGINVTSRDIMRLKTMGLIAGDTNEITFTKRGKIVITTMTLGEESEFEKKRQDKPYSEILASMKKGSGYRIPKFASNNTNRLNLKG